MLGEGNDESVENLSDEELHINNEALKSLFLNILQRLDDTDTLIESLTQNLNTANNEIKKLNNKNNILKNNKINDQLCEIHDEIFNLDCRIIETEQYSRRESLEISGIPEDIPQKDLEQKRYHKSCDRLV